VKRSPEISRSNSKKKKNRSKNIKKPREPGFRAEEGRVDRSNEGEADADDGADR
jgi:hypothetical protein